MDNCPFNEFELEDAAKLINSDHRYIFKGERAEALIKKPKDSHAPAIEFENKHGLTGIAGQYDMPDNRPREAWDADLVNQFAAHLVVFEKADMIPYLDGETQKKMDDIRQDLPKKMPQMLNVLDSFTEKNPELSGLELDRTDYREVYWAITGVTSGFNVDDINFYKKTKDNVDAKDENLAKTEKLYRDRVNKKYPGIRWRPSPKTMQTMIQQEPKTKDAEKPKAKTIPTLDVDPRTNIHPWMRNQFDR